MMFAQPSCKACQSPAELVEGFEVITRWMTLAKT